MGALGAVLSADSSIDDKRERKFRVELDIDEGILDVAVMIDDPICAVVELGWHSTTVCQWYSGRILDGLNLLPVGV